MCSFLSYSGCKLTHPRKLFKNDQIVATSYRVIILLQPAQEWWDRSGFSWDKAYYDSATYREVAANTLVILALTNKKISIMIGS